MVSLREALKEQGNPDVRHIVSVSGGKDSTALAVYLRKNYPELPAEFVFCDTQAELPETYDYLDRLEALLGQEIVRLNALDLTKLAAAKKPNRSAFDFALYELYGGFLPSPRARWCTRLLKIEPFEQYVGSGTAYSYIGIRADEDRDGYVAKKPPVFSEKPNILPVYPFRDAGIGFSEVIEILEASGLGYPEYYRWRSRSGCYFCFYQQVGEWQRLKDEHPDLFEAAKRYERVEGDRAFTWVQGRSLAELEKIEKRYPLPIAEDSPGCAICHL